MSHEEVWIKSYCSECKSCNWICEGDMEDLTCSDTEAIECWKCSHQWWRCPDFVTDIHGDDEDPKELLDSHAEKGQEKPDV